MQSRDGGCDTSPMEKTLRATRSGRPSSHAPIRAERSTPDSHAPPLSRNETARPPDRARSRPLRQRPPNRETPNDRPAPPPIPQRTTNHPEQQPLERNKHDSQTSPEDGDARVDDEPLHHEAHGTIARVTTTRNPTLGPHTARVVERAREVEHGSGETFSVEPFTLYELVCR